MARTPFTVAKIAAKLNQLESVEQPAKSLPWVNREMGLYRIHDRRVVVSYLPVTHAGSG